MLRGFLSGIALTVLVAIGVFSAVNVSNAQSGGDSDPVWSYDNAASTTDTTTAITDTSTPATSSQQQGTTDGYVALGDSVAAGLGLPTWDNATAQDKTCGRSPQAYAFEVGRQLNRPHVLFACSGASSGDLFTRQWISNSNPNIQLNQAFAQGTPALISITVGANDIGWRQLIERCYSSTCGTDRQNRLVDTALLLMERNLNKALAQIDERSGDTLPTVILTGYYNPVSQQCAAVLPDRVTGQEVAWISDGVNKLNQRLQAIASSHDSFVRFAPVDFSGHDLCSSDPWIQGLAASSGSAPIHPTAAGQQAIARAVVAAARQ